MKNLLKITVLLLFTFNLSLFTFGQTPNQFKYQAVLRDANGGILANQNKTIVIDILQTSPSGTSVFTETHNVTTTAQGLIYLNIGSIQDLSGIDWTIDEYFVQITVDGTVMGTSQLLSVPYAIQAKNVENFTGTITESQISDLGTYIETETDPAFTAWDKTTGISITESQISDLGTYLETETDPVFTAWDKTTGISITESQISDLQNYATKNMNNENITNLANPVNNQDAATKAYVDLLESTVQNLLARVEALENGTALITVPTVTTTTITAIAQIAATGGGNVTANGGAEVTARGVVYSISENPTVETNLGITSDGTGTGEFTSFLTGLTAETTYYVRAYATNNEGTAYGSQVSFTTLAESTGSITDADGNVYTSVVIGTQEWLVENLKTTKYNDGTSIPNVTDNGTWTGLSTPANCWYQNNYATYGTVYGALYNWYVVDAASNGGKNVCPVGWHVPTDAEWTTLTTYLGGESVAGGKMKETGTTHWLSPNTGATNESGFTALPGGGRGPDGTFGDVGYFGYYWSSTQDDASYAWDRYLSYYYAIAYRDYNNKQLGFSVRCIKD